MCRVTCAFSMLFVSGSRCCLCVEGCIGVLLEPANMRSLPAFSQASEGWRQLTMQVAMEELCVECRAQGTERMPFMRRCGKQFWSRRWTWKVSRPSP